MPSKFFFHFWMLYAWLLRLHPTASTVIVFGRLEFRSASLGGPLVGDWLVPTMIPELGSRVVYTPGPRGRPRLRLARNGSDLASLCPLSCLSSPLPPHPLWFSPGSSSLQSSLHTNLHFQVCFWENLTEDNTTGSHTPHPTPPCRFPRL